jgi:membrane dipeptidase
MNATDLHSRAIVIDGLNVSKWSKEVFLEMNKSGITAANCTCSVWENFYETINNISKWKKWFAEYDDLILQVFTTKDIKRAKQEKKTGVILGFQNTYAFDNKLGNIRLFKDLGVGIAQMTYNTQNSVGSGCYESKDGGLSDFGHEVVAEMNQAGIMCDLSHVGPQTSKDVILASQKPVCYSHCLPTGLKEHPRNKSDEQLTFIADHGGFIGVTMFSPFLKKGNSSTVDDYIEAIDYVVNLVGDDCVGIGTDFTQGYGPSFFEWITLDKGNGRKLTELGKIINPEGIRQIGDFPNLTDAMNRAGWPDKKICKILGENWTRILNEVWGV